VSASTLKLHKYALYKPNSIGLIPFDNFGKTRRFPSMAMFKKIIVMLNCMFIAQVAIAQSAGHGADFTGVYNNTGLENSGFGARSGLCKDILDENKRCSVREYPYNELGKKTIISVLETGEVDCVPDGLLRLAWRGLYNIQIWHEPEAVKIAYQFGGVVRTIHLDGKPVPENTPHTLHGYSVGEWKGDVLHIETTHLSPAFSALIGGFEATTIAGATSDQARITERWWPSPDKEGALMMDLVVDDPVYYEKPFLKGRRQLLIVPTLSKVDEWDCVSASNVLLDENPDLDAFFDN
jgi:hypothetical protein